MVTSTHEQNSICSPKKLNDIAHEHTIICRQLFAGHVVGSRPMKRKKHLHRMIIVFVRSFILWWKGVTLRTRCTEYLLNYVCPTIVILAAFDCHFSTNMILKGEMH